MARVEGGVMHQPMTDRELIGTLKAGGIDLEAMPLADLVLLVLELARTHGLPDVAIAAALARRG